MKHIKKQCRVILAASFLCLGLMFGIDAFAADKSPCSEDIAKFCKNIEPGMVALMGCLEKHENELSDACKEYESTMLGPRAEKREKVRELTTFRQSCINDMRKFCNDVDPGQGGLMRCLKEHENELSTACNESITALQN